MTGVNGKTRVCGLFGCPVEHTFSPAMHNAAFESLELNWVYVPFRVKPDRLPDAVAAVRAMDLAGVNITVPHKQAVVKFMDRLDPAARMLGAVNTVVNSGGVLTGHNTDGEGFVRALGEDAGIKPADGPALILGAGGAARAVAIALALSGSPEVIIANRTAGRAGDLCDLIAGQFRCASFVLNWPELPVPGSRLYDDWAEVMSRVKLVVQATPMGMHPAGGGIPPFPFELVNSGQVLVDLIYNPSRTGFMRQGEAAGARVFNGTGMLLHQGAIAFELWTGQEAPLEVMRGALRNELQAGRRETGDGRRETGGGLTSMGAVMRSGKCKL